MTSTTRSTASTFEATSAPDSHLLRLPLETYPKSYLDVHRFAAAHPTLTLSFYSRSGSHLSGATTFKAIDLGKSDRFITFKSTDEAIGKNGLVGTVLLNFRPREGNFEITLELKNQFANGILADPLNSTPSTFHTEISRTATALDIPFGGACEIYTPTQRTGSYKAEGLRFLPGKDATKLC